MDSSQRFIDFQTHIPPYRTTFVDSKGQISGFHRESASSGLIASVSGLVGSLKELSGLCKFSLWLDFGLFMFCTY